MTLQLRKIDMIGDRTGEMVSKVSKSLGRKKDMVLVGLWMADGFLEILKMFSLSCISLPYNWIFSQRLLLIFSA